MEHGPIYHLDLDIAASPIGHPSHPTLFFSAKGALETMITILHIGSPAPGW